MVLAVSSNPVVSPLKTSTYYVTVSNNIGCTAIYQHEIVVAPTPTLTVSADVTICPGEEVTLTATSNAGGNYTWSDGQTGSTIVVNPEEILYIPCHLKIPTDVEKLQHLPSYRLMWCLWYQSKQHLIH
ncbi:hypothetical protein MASR1M65_30900 [Saprospiraceae bacterium]